MGDWSVYPSVARLAFRRQATYRSAMLAALFTNVVFGFILAGLMRAVVATRGTVDGWDATDLVTYTFAVQALLGCVASFGERELALRVISGEIAMDFVRPVRLEGWVVAGFVGRSAAQLVVRTVPTFLAGALVFDLRLPGLRDALASVPALVLAVLVAATWWLVVNLTSFWVVNAKGTVQLATIIGYVLAGISFPLVLLPNHVERIVRWLPWAAQVQLPVEVFVAKRPTTSALLSTYALQAGWVLALLGLAHLMVRAGHRRLVVQGG